jgi:hypothetical protein
MQVVGPPASRFGPALIPCISDLALAPTVGVAEGYPGIEVIALSQHFGYFHPETCPWLAANARAARAAVCDCVARTYHLPRRLRFRQSVFPGLGCRPTG